MFFMNFDVCLIKMLVQMYFGDSGRVLTILTDFADSGRVFAILTNFDDFDNFLKDFDKF